MPVMAVAGPVDRLQHAERDEYRTDGLPLETEELGQLDGIERQGIHRVQHLQDPELQGTAGEGLGQGRLHIDQNRLRGIDHRTGRTAGPRRRRDTPRCVIMTTPWGLIPVRVGSLRSQEFIGLSDTPLSRARGDDTVVYITELP